MSIHLEIYADNAVDLAQQIQEIAAGFITAKPVAIAVDAQLVPEATPKRTRAAKPPAEGSKIKFEADELEALGKPDTTGSDASTSTSAPVMTLAEARAALQPIMADPAKAPGVTQLIAAYGVTQLSKVPVEELAILVAAAGTL